MPFQINLDACVLASVGDYPYILGNLMMNDYIRGLDPEKADKRIVKEHYLTMFNDNLHNRQRERHPDIGRTITQISSAVEGYKTDARGAALVYSKWLAKWYVGLGRIKNIFEGVFACIGRMKILLIEEGMDHTTIFTQRVEEAMLRSFCRCLLPDSAGAEDDAVDWYREALRHNRVHCLELCMDEFLLPQMDIDSLEFKDPGTHTNHQDISEPNFMADTFADNHPAVLTACFGESHGDTLAEQSIGRLCHRVLEQSLGALRDQAREHTKGGKFNLQRTLVDEGGDDTYSAVVCCESYFKIDSSEFRPVQPSMAGLRGIALVFPQSDFDANNIEAHERLMKILSVKREPGTVSRNDVRLGPRRGHTTDETVRWLSSVRTDLFRNLVCHGFTGIKTAFSFICKYSEGGDHDGAQAMCLAPPKQLGQTRMFAFWPHNNPKIDRGPVPVQCVQNIHMINQTLLDWEASVLGEEGFQSIAAPGDTKVNQQAPALKTPKAVRPMDVEPPAAKKPFRTGPQHFTRAEYEAAHKMVPYADRTVGGVLKPVKISLDTPARPSKRRRIHPYLEDSHGEGGGMTPSEPGRRSTVRCGYGVR